MALRKKASRDWVSEIRPVLTKQLISFGEMLLSSASRLAP